MVSRSLLSRSSAKSGPRIRAPGFDSGPTQNFLTVPIFQCRILNGCCGPRRCCAGLKIVYTDEVERKNSEAWEYEDGIRDYLLEDLEIYKISHSGSYKHRVLPSIIPFYNYIGGMIPARLVGPGFVKFMRYTGLTKLFYDNRTVTIRGIPQPTRREYYRMCKQIVDGEINYVLNGRDWGLINEQLDDYKVVCADWDC